MGHVYFYYKSIAQGIYLGDGDTMVVCSIGNHTSHCALYGLPSLLLFLETTLWYPLNNNNSQNPNQNSLDLRSFHLSLSLSLIAIQRIQ
eukprot:gene5709-4072_t